MHLSYITFVLNHGVKNPIKTAHIFCGTYYIPCLPELRCDSNKHVIVWVKDTTSEGYGLIDHISDPMQKRHKSIVNALELHLFPLNHNITLTKQKLCTCYMKHTIRYVCEKLSHGVNKHLQVWVNSSTSKVYRWTNHINDLMHERDNSIAKALEFFFDLAIKWWIEITSTA